jgi:adenylate kinase family enzyme
MERICIIGNGGSGKSTFADKLGKALHRSVIHLDKEFWNPDWEKRFTEKEYWQDHQKKLAMEPSWIMEGDYRSDIALRLDRADMVIFFDISPWKCSWRVIKRAFDGKPPFDKHPGMKNKVSPGFIRYLFAYPYDEVRGLLKNYSHKKIFVIKNDKDAEIVFSSLA